MEINATPNPMVIRDLIVKFEYAQPIVFRQIHKDWYPVTISLESYGDLLKEGPLYSCRLGMIQSVGEEPQWESKTRSKLLSWKSMINWSSDDEWIYFDYKNMKDVVTDKYLQEFQWSKLGFPERDGSLSNIWIGSSGCCTPCHFDTYGFNLVCQVKGRKRWLLFPPEDNPFLAPTRVPYEESSVYSKFNFVHPSPSAIQDLVNTHGITIVLEPGDVLYLPPKWWHFVQSEDFSISVNTWVEIPSDVEMRIDEAIMRSIVSSLVSVASPQQAVGLLNPNEDELIDTTETQIEEFLRSSSADWFAQKAQNDREIPTLEEIPMTKKVKLSILDAPNSSSVAEFLQIDSQHVQTMEPFDPVTFYKHAVSRDRLCTHESSKTTTHIVHLLDAVGHPDVLKVIRTQFLENIRSSKRW